MRTADEKGSLEQDAYAAGMAWCMVANLWCPRLRAAIISSIRVSGSRAQRLGMPGEAPPQSVAARECQGVPRRIPTPGSVEHLTLPRRIAPFLADHWPGGPGSLQTDNGRVESPHIEYKAVGLGRIGNGGPLAERAEARVPAQTAQVPVVSKV